MTEVKASESRSGAHGFSVAVYGLTSCGGDQMVFIDGEEEFSALDRVMDLRRVEVTDAGHDIIPADVALVEGAVVTPADEERARLIRAKSRFVVAMGTCACWGGLLASGPLGDAVRPLREVIAVDFALPGCPVQKDQIQLALGSLAHGDIPRLPTSSVCNECKIAEHICYLRERKVLCLGPITVGGCGAACLRQNVPCAGCRGPTANANPAALLRLLLGAGDDGAVRASTAQALRIYAGDSILAPEEHS